MTTTRPTYRPFAGVQKVPSGNPLPAPKKVTADDLRYWRGILWRFRSGPSAWEPLLTGQWTVFEDWSHGFAGWEVLQDDPNVGRTIDSGSLLIETQSDADGTGYQDYMAVKRAVFPKHCAVKFEIERLSPSPTDGRAVLEWVYDAVTNGAKVQLQTLNHNNNYIYRLVGIDDGLNTEINKANNNQSPSLGSIWTVEGGVAAHDDRGEEMYAWIRVDDAAGVNQLYKRGAYTEVYGDRWFRGRFNFKTDTDDQSDWRVHRVWFKSTS